MSDEKLMGQAIQIDEALDLNIIAQNGPRTVEETLNAMLEGLKGAPALRCGRDRASEARQEMAVAMKVQICRPAPARSISRFRNCGARPSRRPSSTLSPWQKLVEEALIQHVFGGGFQFGAWRTSPRPSPGTRVSPSTVSNLNKKIMPRSKAELWGGSR